MAWFGKADQRGREGDAEYPRDRADLSSPQNDEAANRSNHQVVMNIVVHNASLFQRQEAIRWKDGLRGKDALRGIEAIGRIGRINGADGLRGRDGLRGKAAVGRIGRIDLPIPLKRIAVSVGSRSTHRRVFRGCPPLRWSIEIARWFKVPWQLIGR